MHISTILKNQFPSFSFEFFPPKTALASDELLLAITELKKLAPSFVSVTYGAGGSTRELTRELVVRIQKEIEIPVVSHLTCVGSSAEEIDSLLTTYVDQGIGNVLALRGDPPTLQAEWVPTQGGFTYANSLVAFIKKSFPSMGIGVAGFPEGHPKAVNRLIEMDHLKAKVDAGADYICTQLFFDNHEFYDFRERCELAHITIPIIAGIMPIVSVKGMQRMAELSPNTRFPARLQRAIGRAESSLYVENVGVQWASEQVRDLIDNKVAGIHFYTLNKSAATRRIYESLGVSNSQSLCT